MIRRRGSSRGTLGGEVSKGKVGSGWLVWAALTFVAGLLFLYYTPSLLGNLTEIPADFLTGLLTFDGIMLAVIALTFAPSSGGSDLDARWLAAGMSIPFLMSALFTLYSLLRLHTGEFGATSAFIGHAESNAIAFASLGIILWIASMLGYRFIFPSK